MCRANILVSCGPAGAFLIAMPTLYTAYLERHAAYPEFKVGPAATCKVFITRDRTACEAASATLAKREKREPEKRFVRGLS
jgi:hypothetical protein